MWYNYLKKKEKDIKLFILTELWNNYEKLNLNTRTRNVFLKTCMCNISNTPDGVI